MKKITLLVLLLFCLNSLTAQTSIQGTVMDEISYLSLANIHIKNTTKGTTSDDQGNFTLKVKKGDTLAISYTGYLTQEIVIDTQKFIEIILENESLDEIILTDRYPRKISCGYYSYTITIIEDVIKTSPSIFPNPSSDGIFHLKMPSLYKEVQVYVTNLLGQQVKSKRYQNTNTSITLDLTSMKTGIYLINMVADGEHLPTQKAIRK